MDANAEIVKQELELEESSVRVESEYECKDKLNNEPEIYLDVEEKHSNNLPSISVKNEPNEEDDKYDELYIEIEKLKKEFSLSTEDGETKMKTEQLMMKSESNDDDTETGDADCSVRNTLHMEPVSIPHTSVPKRLAAQSAFDSVAERPHSVSTVKKKSRFIDTGVVIDGVHYRCCLWDASNTNYKNKDARIRAWEEICEEMFEDVSREEKDKLVKLIQQRWRTARDAYIKFKTSQRNCRSGSGAKKLKKYVYAQRMQFLDRKAKKHTDESISSPLLTNSTFRSSSTQESNAPITPPSTSSPQLITETVTQTTATSSQNCNSSRLSPKKKRNRAQLQPNSEFENQMLTLLKQNVTDISSDDMSFFQSLGPIIKNFTTYQKLLFRSEVLNSAMSIHCMSNSVSGASPSNVSTNNSSEMQTAQQSADI